MNILEKLGLAPKKKEGAPIIGEKKKQQEQTSTLKYNTTLRVLIILAFLGVLVASIPQTTLKEPVNYSQGEPWRGEDLTAPFTFAIKKSQDELEQERQTIRETTPPIFHMDNSARVNIQSRLDSLFRDLQSVTQVYTEWQNAKENNESDRSRDSLRLEQRKNQFPISLSDSSWETLLENYESVRAQNQTPETKTANGSEFITVDLKDQLEELINELLEDGIINIPKSEISNDEITIRNLRERTERTVNLVNVRSLAEATEYAAYRLSRSYYEDIADVGSEIFSQVIRPNLVYNDEDTQARIEEALADISSSKGAVTEGQVIIRKGDIVTKERFNMLQSLAEARAQNASTLERWASYGGDVLAIISILTIFFFYLYLYRRWIFNDNSMLLLVLITMAMICISSSITYELEDISPYLVPVAVAPIILTIIFDSRVGLLSTITLALLTGLINGNNFEYVTATTVACSLGLFSVRDIKDRSQFLFTTPGIVFISYVVVVFSFSMTGFDGWSEFGNELFFIAINAVFILFTYPLILLFEKMFQVTTDFTLIELSDTNLPLLKQLMTKAPGTFHHSLQVSNLAEAAAGAIGANSLLCRVGGLYHDIGKMENPGYFAENQAGSNDHDKLKPRMSALVIKAHISNGVKMAEENNLPETIIRFIKTHHGTSLIKFFWDKAKKEADSDKKEIREEDFRYDGPLPRTKETGILLLADGIEAASRAMKDPNYQKLENLISKMVDDRVDDGQLSKTPLTFQDLRTIKETFLNILVGIYHSRVEYPEEKKTEAERPTRKIEEGDGFPSPEKPEESPPMDEFYNS